MLNQIVVRLTSTTLEKSFEIVTNFLEHVAGLPHSNEGLLERSGGSDVRAWTSPQPQQEL
jgi:hypothetical protein